MLVQQPSSYSAALSPVLITLHNMMHLINLARHHQVTGRDRGTRHAGCFCMRPVLVGVPVAAWACLCDTLLTAARFRV